MSKVLGFPEHRTRAITGTDRHGQPVTLQPGDRVRYPLRGVDTEDTVRQTFYAFVLVRPYAENYSLPAVVLTTVSWLPLHQLEKI